MSYSRIATGERECVCVCERERERERERDFGPTVAQDNVDNDVVTN